MFKNIMNDITTDDITAILFAVTMPERDTLRYSLEITKAGGTANQFRFDNYEAAITAFEAVRYVQVAE